MPNLKMILRNADRRANHNCLVHCRTNLFVTSLFLISVASAVILSPKTIVCIGLLLLASISVFIVIYCFTTRECKCDSVSVLLNPSEFEKSRKMRMVVAYGIILSTIIVFAGAVWFDRLYETVLLFGIFGLFLSFTRWSFAKTKTILLDDARYLSFEQLDDLTRRLLKLDQINCAEKTSTFLLQKAEALDKSAK